MHSNPLKSSCEMSDCVNSHSKLSTIQKCWLQKVQSPLNHMNRIWWTCRHTCVCLIFVRTLWGTVKMVSGIIVLWGIANTGCDFQNCLSYWWILSKILKSCGLMDYKEVYREPLGLRPIDAGPHGPISRIWWYRYVWMCVKLLWELVGYCETVADVVMLLGIANTWCGFQNIYFGKL